MDIALFESGMHWWIQKKPQWTLLNTFYQGLYETRPDHLDKPWWETTVNTLAKWRAFRSPIPPNTKNEIFNRGSQRLARIEQHYHEIRQQAGEREPSIDNVTWEDIAPLFAVLSEIKGGTSPVFASKLGHFIFPSVFFVIDNEATATFPYEVVWNGLQTGWQRFPQKEDARKLLEAELLKSTESIHRLYPYETKIPEMWLIGYNHR